MTAPNDYCTAADITQQYSNIDLSGNAKNGQSFSAILTEQITNVSRALDIFVGKKPGAFCVTSDVTRFFDGPGYGLYSPSQGFYRFNRLTAQYVNTQSLWIGELADTPTSVAMSLQGDLTSYTALASTDYYPWPYNALDDGRPYLRLDLDILYGHYQVWYAFRKGIQIAGKFGYSKTVPADIKQATIYMAARLFNRGKLGFSDRTSYVTGTSTVVEYMSKQDSDVGNTLTHYTKQAI